MTDVNALSTNSGITLTTAAREAALYVLPLIDVRLCDVLGTAYSSAQAKLVHVAPNWVPLQNGASIVGVQGGGGDASADGFEGLGEGYDTSEEAAPKTVQGRTMRKPRLMHHIMTQKHCRPEAKEAAMSLQSWF
jgi:hypothetical protein